MFAIRICWLLVASTTIILFMTSAEPDFAYNPDYLRTYSRLFQHDHSPKAYGTGNMVKIYESQVKVPVYSLNIRVLEPKDKATLLPFSPRIEYWVLNNTYWIDNHLVTNGMFLDFIEKTHRKITLNFKPEEENMPVAGIAWEDAQAYAAWNYKRLPTRYELSQAFQLGKIKPTPYREWTENQQLFVPLKNPSNLTSFRCAM